MISYQYVWTDTTSTRRCDRKLRYIILQGFIRYSRRYLRQVFEKIGIEATDDNCATFTQATVSDCVTRLQVCSNPNGWIRAVIMCGDIQRGTIVIVADPCTLSSSLSLSLHVWLNLLTTAIVIPKFLASESSLTMQASLFFEVEDFLSQFDISTLQGLRTTRNTSDSPTSGSDSPPVIAPYKRHRAYRKRRREERERLEQEVEELKMKLASEPRRQLALAPWKMVSMCQLEARRMSEERQRRLRAAISAQEILIQQYRGIIVDEPIQGTSFDNSGFLHDMLRVESFDTAFYQASAATFDAVYAQVDEVFREIQLDSTDERCGMSVHEGTDSSGKNYVQFTDKRSVPFTFEQSSGVLTRTLEAHQESDQQPCDGIQEPDTTVCIKFRVSTKLKTGENASVLLRVMNRRYQEEKRMVVVWRAFAEGEGAFSGMHADETGWGVLTPSSTRTENSILRLYARYMSLSVGTVASEHVEKQFTGLIVEASTQNSGEIACSLENVELN